MVWGRKLIENTLFLRMMAIKPRKELGFVWICVNTTVFLRKNYNVFCVEKAKFQCFISFYLKPLTIVLVKIPRNGDIISSMLIYFYDQNLKIKMFTSTDFYSYHMDWEILLGEYKNNHGEMKPNDEGRYFVLMDNKKMVENATLNELRERAGKKSIKIFDIQNFEKNYAGFSEQSWEDDLIFFSEVNLAWSKLDVEAFYKVLNMPDLILLPENGIKGTKDNKRDVVEKYGIDEKVISVEDDNWGVKAVGAMNSTYTGKDVRIAILDTGFDEEHPSFRKCKKSEYFIGNSASDDHGHGMHCTGIACGAFKEGVRLGVATEAEIYAGKILDENKEGWPREVIMGVYWALANSCHVILLSLGFTLESNIVHPIDPVLTRVFALANKNSCFVVASAGNDSNRSADPPVILPMLSPAENPLTIGVGAINIDKDIFDMSNRASLLDDGFMQQINFVAPGSDIYSLWSTQSKNDHQEPYDFRDGTSMAAAFLAGLLCLYWDKYFRLWSKIEDENPLYRIRMEMEVSSKVLKDSNGIFWDQNDCGNGLLYAP